MWWGLRTWIEEEGALNPDAETEEEILTTGYKPNTRVLTIEPKEDFSARLGRSPDRADSMALAVCNHVGTARHMEAMQVLFV